VENVTDNITVSSQFEYIVTTTPTPAPTPTPTSTLEPTPVPTLVPTPTPVPIPTPKPVPVQVTLGLSTTEFGVYGSPVTVEKGAPLYIKAELAGPATALVVSYPTIGWKEIIIPADPRVVSIVGNTWTILRPIIYNIGSIPVRVAANNAAGPPETVALFY